MITGILYNYEYDSELKIFLHLKLLHYTKIRKAVMSTFDDEM